MIFINHSVLEKKYFMPVKNIMVVPKMYTVIVIYNRWDYNEIHYYSHDLVQA